MTQLPRKDVAPLKLEAEKGLDTEDGQNSFSPKILIIVDTILPAIDGFNVCEKLLLLGQGAPKIVLMTGKAHAIDALK